ncbi:beta-glucosidase [Actinosynnema pretiosum subsp. pretiosum]|uniref:Beta-glucosidase n=2 Tax=Actinosynnema TaxID=40566 RepID=C6WCL5_ACTMD|nr:GH1 family beta-glucosidase [Actinosynnema mirum]ACU35632.1 beta-galactosidase [Actinosynnema mirum DSM 43827]AXX29061.1 Beta-glucosidase [Actinosynnema pretiosum subsp. pretiosum]QUF06659.1 beta-glucosidase [Actinosynnema pretiosum subsp. pretiosum]
MDTTARAAGFDPAIASLPPSFRWGVATSAYQIEGAVAEDGRGPSIWDTYCRVPGMVHEGDNGDVACDHYHRMPEDVELIRSLGVDTYRFSVAWPRVQPGGTGPANPKGLAFYDRLVDELLAKGVDPWVTLYHWDLPQELEDAGGWPVRDTAHRFADYSMLVFDALQDRVRTWTTLNEPWCSAMLGYHVGRQAPGRTHFPDAIKAVHHLLLGHGLATRRMREAAVKPTEFGITLNMGHAAPATDSELDRDAARRADGLGRRIYLHPVVTGEYPADVVADLAARGAELPVRDGDLELISQPIEVLGINHYTSSKHSGTAEDGSTVDADGLPVDRELRYGRPVTAMDWEIVPEQFTELLLQNAREYPDLPPMVITENGAAFDDVVSPDGSVDDADRVAYLDSHIAAVAKAREGGADVRGYFAWSLMDNFEWSYGYEKRFGIVHVDYETQVRTPKASALWYRDVAKRVRES